MAVATDGYTDLPPGLLATLVTYLEMTAPPAPAGRPFPPGLALRRVDRPDPAWYRILYDRIGEDLLWFSRRAIGPAQLAAILYDPAVEVHVLTQDDAEIGLLELDRRVAGEVEIVFFGLVPEAVGGGTGRLLMDRCLEIAWAGPVPPRRVWLHTCAFDHPAALGFYRRSGFRPYRLALELGPDPRLTGAMPRTAAPQIPLIEPETGA
ncbi:GNAT family N-acetyltransferase [Hyphomicrobiaceae bacterium 22]|uniref:GNAT family N-acetyltransferase n=1 Tax=Prosthecodimorpha staleyi TaxID=2840188 RepID=A0A947GCJ3_9HYPH|nr:GNAT family N-acetyltransferase [Prosthecodimorpha staleyi]